ncbi:uncharacterized protein TNIN_403751 [Trichonephila inaurata madagascariensis]|uniref:Uncharacterized protein n=1 Tax=Trichonephila inaurata madagascariensis TaxID=2747483 RepID=A0A8X6WP26_9ARAC|nr:uncharacterized protein TNIN_403751 [Trichonephila inaurata madagascariensis]
MFESRFLSPEDVICVRYNPVEVCIPGSEAAVSITPMAPVDFPTVRLPDENRSPVRDGGVLNGQNETSPDASPSINLTDPVPVFPLTIPDDHVQAFPLTISDDPELEEIDHSDSSPNNRAIKTKFGRVSRFNIPTPRQVAKAFNHLKIRDIILRLKQYRDRKSMVRISVLSGLYQGGDETEATELTTKNDRESCPIHVEASEELGEKLSYANNLEDLATSDWTTLGKLSTRQMSNAMNKMKYTQPSEPTTRHGTTTRCSAL